MSDNNSNKYNTNKCNIQQVSINKEGRDENGRFVPGNLAGLATQAQQGDKLACKYKEEYCDSIINYFIERANSTNDNLYKRSYYKDGTIKSEEPIILPPKYPTFELYAISIGVAPNTLLNWCKEYRQFAEAYAQAKSIQLAITKVYAMSKLYDSNFAKFMLVNEHNYQDRQNIQAEVKNLTPEQEKLLGNINNRLNGKSDND